MDENTRVRLAMRDLYLGDGERFDLVAIHEDWCPAGDQGEPRERCVCQPALRVFQTETGECFDIDARGGWKRNLEFSSPIH